MKKFETQVCQFIVDLERDCRNTLQLNNAAKKIVEKLRGELSIPERGLYYGTAYAPIGVLEGKFTFGDEGYLVPWRRLLAENEVFTASFVGTILREFLLIEWWYDFNSVALHNELWEFFAFGMNRLWNFMSRLERDKSKLRKSSALKKGVDSTNLLDLYSLASAVFVSKDFYELLRCRRDTEIELGFWCDERSIWVMYNLYGEFRLPTLEERSSIIKQAYQKACDFVRCFKAHLLGGAL